MDLLEVGENSQTPDSQGTDPIIHCTGLKK